jgi:hypothetical protein
MILGNMFWYEYAFVDRNFSLLLFGDAVINHVCLFVNSGMIGSGSFDVLGSLARVGKSTEASAVVRDLAQRAMTAKSLLDFYKGPLRERMLNFDCAKTTTANVVYEVILPMTSDPRRSERPCAYATEFGTSAFPDKMVTHNWGNLFAHLITAVIADALQEATYDRIAQKLAMEAGPAELLAELESKGAGGHTYWICAFSVNQHVSICECCEKSQHFQNGDPRCEMDKFDEMMALLRIRDRKTSVSSINQSSESIRSSEQVSESNRSSAMSQSGESKTRFGQVIAVDREFELFSRAWCLAEIAQAKRSHIPQSMKVFSFENIDHHFGKMENLDVRQCNASRAEDKAHILKKIESYTSIEKFNTDVRLQVYGIAFHWMRRQFNDVMSRTSGPTEEAAAFPS